MWPKPAKKFCEEIGIAHPIIHAPTAGMVSPELAAAISNHGGLGSLAAGYLSPESITADITAYQALSRKPFAVNFFVPASYHEDTVRITNMIAHLQSYWKILGLPMPPPPHEYRVAFDQQLAMALQHHMQIASFTFGIPAPEVLNELKAKQIYIIGTATTVREAIAWEKAGADAIVAQGYEAGGHRGSFLADPEHSLIGLMALLPQMVDQVKIPVIAAGGIMDGRGVMAALALGASAVQMGTAFLTCHESACPDIQQQAILNSNEESTQFSRAFTGKLARGIRNEFMQETDETHVPDYPIQHALTSALRKAALQTGRTKWMSLWAGQGTRLSQRKTAAALLQEVIEQAQRCRQGLL